MDGSLDKQPQNDRSVYGSFGIKLIALPVLIVVALIGMAVSHPSATQWIADAAQAEFVGTEFVATEIVPDLARPTQIARPANQIRTVHAD
jgi:hypothetical protein